MRTRWTLSLLAVLTLLLPACGGGRGAANSGPTADADGGVPSDTRGGTPSTHPVDQIGMVQVFVLPGTLPWEVQAAVSKARGAGADVVALRAFQLDGDRPHEWVAGADPKSGVYFPSSTEPVVDSELWSVFVQAAHAEGLRAWAWMTTLDCRWMLEEHPDWAGTQWDPVGEEFRRTRKLDPFRPEVEARLVSVFQELARSGVDGILFQDDLVLRHLEGYGSAAEAEWKEYTGVKLDPRAFYQDVSVADGGRIRVGRYTEEYRVWSRWRAKRLLDLATLLAKEAKLAAERPFEVCLNIYYDELHNPEGGLLWLAREWDRAVQRPFDRFAVMAYHRQISKETGKEGDALLQVLGSMSGRLANSPIDPRRAVVKLQTVDWKTREPIDTMELEWALEPWVSKAPVSLGLAPWDPEHPVHLPEFRTKLSEEPSADQVEERE